MLAILHIYIYIYIFFYFYFVCLSSYFILFFNIDPHTTLSRVDTSDLKDFQHASSLIFDIVNRFENYLSTIIMVFPALLCILEMDSMSMSKIMVWRGLDISTRPRIQTNDYIWVCSESENYSCNPT